MKKLLLTFCTIVVLCAGAYAQQTFTIKGKVMDTNGEHLPGVNIIVKGTTIGTSTDLDGNFILHKIPSGVQTISARYVGYETSRKVLNIQKDQTINFKLKSGIVLEGLVVTAQKREQSIKDIPTAITSLGGQFIKETGQTEIQDLASYIPGLEIQVQSPNNPGFVIRGITSDSGEANIEPRVSIFQDGVSISKSRGSVVEMFDMERIEALKGPQGTLFGRGAQIGALHFIQNKPKNIFDLGGTLGYGSYGYKHAEAFVNAPILKNKLFFRTAGIYKFRDGYAKNLSGGTLNGKNTRAIRASLKFVPTTSTNFTLIYNYQNDNAPGTLFKSGTYAPKGGDLSPYTFADLEQGKNLGLKRTVWGLTLLGKHSFNPNLSLTSISAYREFDSHEKFDSDGTAAPALFFGEKALGKQFSQEFRFNFNVGNKFQGFAGFNYFHENGSQKVTLNSDERSFLALASPLAAPVVNKLLQDKMEMLITKVKTDAKKFGLDDETINNFIKLFGLDNNIKVSEVPLVDKEGKPVLPKSFLDLINFNQVMRGFMENPTTDNKIIDEIMAEDFMSGSILAVAVEKPEFKALMNSPEMKLLRAELSKDHSEYYKNYGNNSSFEVFADGTYSITKKLKATAGIRYTLEDIESGIEAGGEPNAHLGIFRHAGPNLLVMPTEKLTKSKRFHSAVGRAALNYALNKNWEAYTSFAHGRRPNVIQFNAEPNPDKLTSTYNPQILHDERVNSYEAGVKGFTLNNSLYIDAAMYYYNYSHFQTRWVDPRTLTLNTKDAGNARSFGFETSFKWQLLNNLEAFGNYAYINARFADKDSEGNKQEYAGNTFRLTPKNSFALGLDASFAVVRNIGFFIRPVYQYKSKIYFEEDNKEIESQNGYGLLNLRTGFIFAKQHLLLSFFANNLLNEKYLLDAGNAGKHFNIPTYIAGSPRMFGIELTYNLK